MIIAISVDPPPIFVATRASRKGISETPPILNPSAPLNTVAGDGTVGTLPARGIGLAKAEYPSSGTVPNASSLTKSRSIDFASLMTTREESGSLQLVL